MPDDDDDNDDRLFAAARRVRSVLGGERTRYIDPQSGAHEEVRQRPRAYMPEPPTVSSYIDPQSGTRPIVRDVDTERGIYRNYYDPNTGDYYSIADESPTSLRHERRSYIDPQAGTRLPVEVDVGEYYDPSTSQYLSTGQPSYSDFSDMPEPKGTYIDPQSGEHVMPVPRERPAPHRDVRVEPKSNEPTRFFIREPEPTPEQVSDEHMRIPPRKSVDPPLRKQVTQKDEPKRASRKG